MIRELLNILLFYKICVGFFIYSVVIMIIFWINFDKYIKRILSYDDFKKERTIKALKLLHRIVSLMSHVYVITIYMAYKFDHGSDINYVITAMIIVFIIDRAIHFFKKKALCELNNER